ncbi:STAS domain-containing protein [Candidatus Margulisiibacteriota bacterium]
MLKFEDQNNVLNVFFPRRLDTDFCLTETNKIEEKFTPNISAVIFNMQDVDYISSAFLRICITTGKKLGRENFSLINVLPEVKKVFKIAGIDKILEIKDKE